MSQGQKLFEIEHRDGIGIVRFLDRIELYEAATIRTDIMEWIDANGPTGVVFSFADVPYIDSSGVGVFVNLQYQLADRMPLRLCRMSQTVRDVLTFTNLVSRFEIDDTEEESIQAIRKSNAKD
jgi:anti-anti-sigma factor